jgi:polyisoprenoid-binding protein YceI
MLILIENLFAKTLKGNNRLMKKTLIFLIISNVIFGQIDVNKEIVPKKRPDRIIKADFISTPESSKIKINNESSTLKWKGGLKFGIGEHEGTIDIIRDDISIIKNKISGTIIVDMNTISNTDLPNTSGEKLVKHLKSTDFFDVKNYPTSEIKILKTKIIGKQPNGYYEILIYGDLTIKSITIPCQFVAYVNFEQNIKFANGVLKFNRNDFEIRYRSESQLSNPDIFWNKLKTAKNATKDKVISDEIILNFEIISEPEIKLIK